MGSKLLSRLAAISSQTPAERPQQKPIFRELSEIPLPRDFGKLESAALQNAGLPARADFDVERCLFLDTETTGLSQGTGTVAFLVGMGYVRGDKFVVEQLMLRDYGGEAELLLALAERARDFDSVVTFNGGAFDLPLLANRYIMCRMRDMAPNLVSLDLLPPAKRLWRLRLKSCRLANLEEKILGAPRGDDLPGSEAPKRFFEYLQTGDETLLRPVLTHNRQDIVTLLSLLRRLCRDYQMPEALSEPADLFSAGKVMETRGELPRAERLYRLAGKPRPVTTLSALLGERYGARANLRLLRMAKRAGRDADADALIAEMIARKQGGAIPYVELAKREEHIRRDNRAALTAALEAQKRAKEAESEEIDRRIIRLLEKIRREEDK